MRHTEYLGHSIHKWAKAIALRISDEWNGNLEENREDVILLRKSLEHLLKKNQNVCKALIGTTIVEEDYFDEIQ